MKNNVDIVKSIKNLMGIQLTQLEALLDKIGIIDFQYQKTKQKDRFNIFNLLSRKFDEVNLHSKFIYELLSPDSSHGCGTAFLEKLLFHLQIKDFDLADVEVYREYRKIDLLIKNKKQAIVIENKLWATDQPGQLERYYKLLFDEGYRDIKIFYLSINGKDPDPHSIGDLYLLENWSDLFSVISYEFTIEQWLDSCIKEAYERPALRETLIQYRLLIQEISGKTMNKEEMHEIVALIAKEDNVVKAKKIAENWNHVKWFTEWYFWQDLEKLIQSEFDILDLQKYSEDRLNRAIHYSRNKDLWYGIMFKIGEFEGDDACLFIERGEENVYYGLTMVRANSKRFNKEPKFRGLALKVEEFSEWGLEDHWIGGNYCYPHINFNSFSNDTTLRLLNDDFRPNYIHGLWPTIKAFIAKAKDAINKEAEKAISSDLEKG